MCVYILKIFHFKQLLHSAGKTGVKEMKLKFSELKEFVRPVQNALGVLPAALKVLTSHLMPVSVVCEFRIFCVYIHRCFLSSSVYCLSGLEEFHIFTEAVHIFTE